MKYSWNALANQMSFNDVKDCVVNNEIAHLTKDDLEPSKTKIKNKFIQKNVYLSFSLQVLLVF